MNVFEPTTQQRKGYARWVKSRPPAVRAIAERFEPWGLYRMKRTGQRVSVMSFGEEIDGRVTLTVYVSGDFNLTLFERQVFGVPPDDLEPCDLPAEDEVTGALMTPADVDANLPALRAMVKR